jgi:hypothetical protein
LTRSELIPTVAIHAENAGARNPIFAHSVAELSRPIPPAAAPIAFARLSTPAFQHALRCECERTVVPDAADDADDAVANADEHGPQPAIYLASDAGHARKRDASHESGPWAFTCQWPGLYGHAEFLTTTECNIKSGQKFDKG